MKNKFVHLRVHTVYSLSESTLRISDLAKLAQDDYQPAMAITDSQNLFGAYEFSKNNVRVWHTTYNWFFCFYKGRVW